MFFFVKYKFEVNFEICLMILIVQQFNFSLSPATRYEFSFFNKCCKHAVPPSPYAQHVA
jgi:hypothetical protein